MILFKIFFTWMIANVSCVQPLLVDNVILDLGCDNSCNYFWLWLRMYQYIPMKGFK